MPKPMAPIKSTKSGARNPNIGASGAGFEEAKGSRLKVTICLLARARKMTPKAIRKNISLPRSFNRGPHEPSLFRRSRKSLPALKKGTHFSATATASPVLGLRPILGGRILAEKAPNPLNSTRSPRPSASVISSSIVFTTRSTSL